VTQLQRSGPAEGWQKDPYGRHELRFFDGQKWTSYVRDGQANGVDEPGGPVPGVSPPPVRSRLLDEDVLVVERFTDLGRRWSDRSVHGPDGRLAGVLRRAALVSDPPYGGLRSSLHRDHSKYDVVELVDHTDAVVLTLVRPLGAGRISVAVLDSEGEDAGRIMQQSLRRNETTYAFLGPNGGFLGDLQSDNWLSWDMRIVDSHGRQIATIGRDFTGLDRTKFSKPDDYVVRITKPVHEPLRTLVLACALSLEVTVKAGLG
jgi:hypothetical protein